MCELAAWEIIIISRVWILQNLPIFHYQQKSKYYLPFLNQQISKNQKTKSRKKYQLRKPRNHLQNY